MERTLFRSLTALGAVIATITALADAVERGWLPGQPGELAPVRVQVTAVVRARPFAVTGVRDRGDEGTPVCTKVPEVGK